MKEGKKKGNSFERKLKEIGQEKRRIDHEIKSLSKSLKRGELPPPRAPGGSAPSRSGRIVPDHQMKTTGSSDDVLSVQKEQEAAHTLEEAHRARLGFPLVPEKKMPVYGDKRFTSYFSAGGFNSPMSARRERSIQRNKAVFMVVLVILLGYIIFTVLVR